MFSVTPHAKWLTYAIATLFLCWVMAGLFSLDIIMYLCSAVLLLSACNITLAQLYLLIWCTIPWGREIEFSQWLGTDMPTEPLLWIFCVRWTWQQIHQPHASLWTILRSPILLIAIAGFCWSLFVSIFSAYPLVSFKNTIAKLWYWIPFAIAPLYLSLSKSQIKTIIQWFSISVCVSVLLAFFRHSTHGFAFAEMNSSLYPFWRNHVNYSALLVLTMPAVIWLCHQTVLRERKKIYILLAILLIGAILAYSRGAWLAIPIGLIAAYLLQRKKLLLFIIISSVSLVSLVALYIYNNQYQKLTPDFATTVYHSALADHLAASTQLKDVSNAERLHRYIAGVRMLADKPVLGFGPGTFNRVYQPYTLNRFRTWVSNNVERSTVHNYFLLIGIEQGIPGLLLFLALVFCVIYGIENQLPHLMLADRLAIGSTVCILLWLNLLSDLWEVDKVAPFWFTITALLLAPIVTAKNAPSTRND